MMFSVNFALCRYPLQPCATLTPNQACHVQLDTKQTRETKKDPLFPCYGDQIKFQFRSLKIISMLFSCLVLVSGYPAGAHALQFPPLFRKTKTRLPRSPSRLLSGPVREKWRITEGGQANKCRVNALHPMMIDRPVLCLSFAQQAYICAAAGSAQHE